MYHSSTAENFNTTCLTCTKGHYCVGGQNRYICGTGRYQDLLSRTSSNDCKACSTGRYQPQNARTNISDCIICPVGRYQSSNGYSYCHECPTGKYNNETGSTLSSTCKNCEVGKYRPPPKQNAPLPTNCINCPSDMYQESEGGVNCLWCPGGLYANGENNTHCTKCNAGYFRVEWTGVPPFDYKSGCTRCDSGTISDEGQTSCTNCKPGQYSDATNQDPRHCIGCKSGHYSDVTGAVSCTECPSGWAQRANKTTKCTRCSAGYYQNVDNTECVECPSGYKSDDSMPACTECLKGQFSGPRATVCTSCPVGKYSHQNASKECLLCRDNGMFFTDKNGQIVFMGYTEEEGQYKCARCNPGEKSTGAGCISRNDVSAPSNSPIDKLSVLIDRSVGNKQPDGQSLIFQFSVKPDDLLVKPTRFALEYSFNYKGCEAFGETEYNSTSLVSLNSSTARNNYQTKKNYTEIIDWNKVAPTAEDDFMLFEIRINIPVPAWCQLIATEMNNVTVYAQYGFAVNSPYFYYEDGPKSKYPEWRSATQCDDTSFLDVSSSNPYNWICLTCPIGVYCEGPLVFKDLRARFGFYRINNNPLTSTSTDLLGISFVICKHPPACLGAPNYRYTNIYEKYYKD